VPAPDAPAKVQVVNHNYNDMNMYVVRSGERIRLGRVIGNSSAGFTLSSGVVTTGAIQLVGVSMGSGATAESDALQVNPGDQVVFTIQQDLAQSMAIVER
jgi:hypothetical protein